MSSLQKNKNINKIIIEIEKENKTIDDYVNEILEKISKISSYKK